jgi:Tol biopolymer transport system component
MTHFSYFDRLVAIIVGGLLLFSLGIVIRGDRVGLIAATLYPLPDTGQVSTQTGVQAIFSQEIAISDDDPIQLSPPVAGRVRWDGRTVAFLPNEPLEPGQTYTVTIPAGLESQQGRPLLEPIQWQFTTAQPRVLFISWDEEDRGQLYLATPGRPEATVQLTQERLGVLDYALSPDGGQIVYAALRDDNGSDLWIMDNDGRNPRLLLDCSGGACSGAVWSPDGFRLVYEQRNMPFVGAPPGPPRLYWLDVSAEAISPVFADSQWLGLAPRFSDDGQWLSYVAPLEQEVQIYNVTDGRTLRITSRMGQPGIWHPELNQLLVTDIQFQDDSHSIHIFLVDLATSQMTNLSGEGTVTSDQLPDYAPDGEWISIGRKQPRQPMGHQIWLLRSDGGETRQLTDNPDIHHGTAHWSPDGRTLLFERYHLSRPNADPEIWLMAVESGALTQISAFGSQPAWLP